MPALYLASKSPRRLSILLSMGLNDVEVLPVGSPVPGAIPGEEKKFPGEEPGCYVVRTAREKARLCAAKIAGEHLPWAPVLAADTAVTINGRILGKPAGREEAREFLSILSGRWHEVRTAVVLIDANGERMLESVSRVHFTTISPERIESYTATAEPYDKAGGYGIQGLAGLFADRIDGSFTGIMGLPAYETGELLRPLGLLPV